MRKWMTAISFLIALVLIFGLATGLFAQQWTTANQITVSWDPVTTNVDGQPITGTVSYKTYFKPELGTIETFHGTVTATQATITFQAEGRFFLGVRSVRNIDGVEIDSSRIAWSNNAADCSSGVTFGVQYYKAPANVINIKLGP